MAQGVPDAAPVRLHNSMKESLMKLTEVAIASDQSETTNGGQDARSTGVNTKAEAGPVARSRRGRKPRNGRGSYTLEELLTALQSLESGDFKARLSEGGTPVLIEIAATFNRLTKQSQRVCDEVARIGRTVGREGKMTDRARVVDLQGGWLDSIDSVNALISDLVQPTTEIARVLTAVAEGDLSARRWCWRSTANRCRASSCASARP